MYDFRTPSDLFMDLHFDSYEFFKKDFDLINCKPRIIDMEEVDIEKNKEEKWEINSIVEYLEK